MSALTELASLRIRERILLALRCARCAHSLGRHSLAVDKCAGDLGGRACACAGWTEPQEQLEIR